jgi:hypothetical protein
VSQNNIFGIFINRSALYISNGVLITKLLDCYHTASEKNELMRFNFFPEDKPLQRVFQDDEIAEFKNGLLEKC